MALSLQCYTSSDSDGSLNQILKRIEREQERFKGIAIMIEDLPENVIAEILSWLPVKDLCRFKSVCKLWNVIISSRHFFEKHMNNYYKNSDSDCLLVQFYTSIPTVNDIVLYELLVDETSGVFAHEELSHMRMYGSHVYGPCDGIYYLRKYFGGRALWNPATNELKVLPSSIGNLNRSPLLYVSDEVCGFGLDRVTNDYKVIVIRCYWGGVEKAIPQSPLSVVIYSLRTNSWSYWGDLPDVYDLKRNKSYIFLDGCCYWFGTLPLYENFEVILSFEMSTEKVTEIEVPNYDTPASRCLGILHDSIAFLTVNDKRFNIWTWDEEFWTKKFTIMTSIEITKPIGSWQKNKLLLTCTNGSLVLCDADTQEIKDLEFQVEHSFEGVFAYKESLLSIKDFGSRLNEEGCSIRTLPSLGNLSLEVADDNSVEITMEIDEHAFKDERDIGRQIDEDNEILTMPSSSSSDSM